jgi:transglutaminase-like putative cysteine protease
MRFRSRAVAAMLAAALLAPALVADVALENPEPRLDPTDAFYAPAAGLIAGMERTRIAGRPLALMYERPAGEDFYNDERYARWFFFDGSDGCVAYEHVNWTYFRREEGELVLADVSYAIVAGDRSATIALSYQNGALREEFVAVKEASEDFASVSRRTGGRIQYEGRRVSCPAPTLAVWSSLYYLDSARALGAAGGFAVFDAYDEGFHLFDASYESPGGKAALHARSRDRSKPVDVTARFGPRGLERVEWPELDDVFFPVQPGELVSWRERLLPDVGYTSADVDTRIADGVRPAYRVTSLSLTLAYEEEAAKRAAWDALEPGLFARGDDPTRLAYAWSAGTPKYRAPTREELVGELVSTQGAIVVGAELRSLALEIVGGETDPSERALALAEWVASEVEYTLEVISQDSLATLENRKGDCSEFASLLASLLRSIDVPCMVVSGLYFDPLSIEFFHHAWVAVWTGSSWLELEATSGTLASPGSYVPSPFDAWGAELRYVEVLEVR